MNSISRSKIELFINCPHCFYLEAKMGIKRPQMLPYTLNSAVDILLKKEFDLYRQQQKSHPIHQSLGLVPCDHSKMDDWREARKKGVQYYHPGHDTLYRGGIDDLWFEPSTGLHFVVDYKCTAKSEVTQDLPEWADGYRRQIEIYQWLLRKNGLLVSDTSYFVYCTGDLHAPTFDGVLKFHQRLIPYKGDDSWVDGVLNDLQACLGVSSPPASATGCTYCQYRAA
jgi:hypothetical protein